METLEQNEYLDSSPDQSSETPEESHPKSLGNSKPEKDGAVGKPVERTQKTLDELLSWLQTLIGEIEESGTNVKLFHGQNMLKIGLGNVHLCPGDKMIRSGLTCPICQ